MQNKSKMVTMWLCGLTLCAVVAPALLFAKPFPPKGEYYDEFRYAVLQDGRCWNEQNGFLNCDMAAELLKIRNDCDILQSNTVCSGNCPAVTIDHQMVAVKQMLRLTLICERL